MFENKHSSALIGILFHLKRQNYVDLCKNSRMTDYSTCWEHQTGYFREVKRISFNISWLNLISKRAIQLFIHALLIITITINSSDVHQQDNKLQNIHIMECSSVTKKGWIMYTNNIGHLKNVMLSDWSLTEKCACCMALFEVLEQ